MSKVRDLLAKKGAFVAEIDRRANILDAARLMAARHIGALVVTEGDTVVGIITERDVLTKVVAAAADPAQMTVEQAMSSPVACCRPDTDLEECRTVITNNRVRHLPVVDEGKLVGIITSGDIMAQALAIQQGTIEQLHHYLYGTHR